MIDDPGLGSSARALLDAARPGMAPDGAAARRMRAGIAASVGGAAVGTAGVKLTLATKLGLGSLVAVFIVGAIVFATGDADPVARRAAVAPVQVATTTPIAQPATTPTPPVAATAAIEEEMPAVAIARHPVAAKADPARPGAPEAPPRVRTPLAREVELVDRAMASLRHGDPRAALAAIHDYEIETTGTGQLAEDAAAIEVEALCAAHDPAATAKLARFDHTYPNSAQRSRLGDACYAKH